MRKKTALWVIPLCVGLAIALLADSHGMSGAIRDSVSLCLNTVVPSLFGFMALSAFAVSLAPRSEPVIFLLSLVGGYPVGASLLCTSSLPQSRKERMLTYCYCGSPAFLLMISPAQGLYIWLSNAAACVVLAVLANLRRFPPEKSPEKAPPPPSESPRRSAADCLVGAVTSTGAALYKICLMIVAFSVVVRLLQLAGISGAALAVAEITALTRYPVASPITAALTSMGGLCVLAQIAAIAGGRLNLGKFLLARIPAAAISAAVCFALTRGAAVPAAATPPAVAISAAGSPTASACLLIMAGILLAGGAPPGLRRGTLSPEPRRGTF